MALTPFAPLSSLGLDTGRFGFDDFFGGALSPWAGGGLLGTQRGVAGAMRPLYTDVVERDKEYEMRVDVPGAFIGSIVPSHSGGFWRTAWREGARGCLARASQPPAMASGAGRRCCETLMRATHPLRLGTQACRRRTSRWRRRARCCA